MVRVFATIRLLEPFEIGGQYTARPERADGNEFPPFASQAVEFGLVFNRVVGLPYYSVFPMAFIHIQYLRSLACSLQRLLSDHRRQITITLIPSIAVCSQSTRI